MLLFAVGVALDLPRRQLGALCGVAIAQPANAVAEWTCPLDKQEWTIAKRQDSSVRIRPETMLAASDGLKREVKLLKIPLGRAAVTSFEPEEQVELARFFASKQAADDIGVEKGACIFRNSLDRQAKSNTSPLIAATVNVPSALLETRQNRRYVTVDYETDGCRRLDEDGQCVGRAKRVANAVITVSLESQARTLEEQRRMDRGELEARHALDPHCVRTDHHQGRQTRRPRRREATISRQHLRHFRSRCMMLSCCAACAWLRV